MNKREEEEEEEEEDTWYMILHAWRRLRHAAMFVEFWGFWSSEPPEGEGGGA